MDALEVLKTRRSVRRYIDREVPREVLSDLADCGRLAASARNLQPCRFVVVTERERKNQLAQMLDHGAFLADASACILVFAEETKYMIEDGAAATQNILLAAKAHGLGSCWIAGHKKEYAEEVERFAGVPASVKLISCVAVGYEDGRAEVKKKELEEVLHWERW